MFNSKKKQLFANHQSLLSPVTRIVGDLYFSGDFYLEGTLKGNIYAEEGKSAKLIVAESSVVEGEIHVPNIVINGKVHGFVGRRITYRFTSAAIEIGQFIFR